MTISAGTFIRLTLLVLIGVVLQLAVVSQLMFFDSNADLAPLIVLSVGLLAGPVAGSITGFAAGFVVDMSLVQTVGLSSLLLTGVGYLAGRYRELRDASNSLVPPVGAALATLAFSAAFSVTQFLLGVESSVSPLLIRDFLVEALLNTLLAIPVFAVVRAILRPSLVEPNRPRRRSPLSGVRITTSS